MLKRAENAKVVYHSGLFGGRGWLTLTVGKQFYRVARFTKEQFQLMTQEQERTPVGVGRVGERNYWWFQRRIFSDSDNLRQDEVYALLVTRHQREQQRIATAQATVAVGAKPQASTRGAIPDDVKQFVWARDGGHCRSCGSGVELQFDHVIPIALGGSSTADNLQVLCGPCNRRKGAGLTTGRSGSISQGTRPLSGSPNSPVEEQPWWKQMGT